MNRCPMCGGLGWTLDCNDVGKPGPRMVEFLRCFHPECDVSGQPVQSIAFKGIEFTKVAKHPSRGFVMSLSGGATTVERDVRSQLEEFVS